MDNPIAPLSDISSPELPKDQVTEQSAMLTGATPVRGSILKIKTHSLKHAFGVYRRGAQSRNLYFDLTLRDFQDLWNSDCAYCGKRIDGIGIDRVNSGRGYERENVVPCCGRCNWMKREMGVSEFVEHIQRIYQCISREGWEESWPNLTGKI